MTLSPHDIRRLGTYLPDNIILNLFDVSQDDIEAAFQESCRPIADPGKLPSILEAFDRQVSRTSEATYDEALVDALVKRVDVLGLGVRASNRVQSAGIEFVWELVIQIESAMLKSHNFGTKSLNEIKGALLNMHKDLRLGMSPDHPAIVEAKCRTTG